MLDDKNNSMHKNQNDRNLSDVFKELQEIRYSQANQVNTSSKSNSDLKRQKQFNMQTQSATQRQSKPKAKVSFIESTDVSFDNKKGVKLSNLLIVLLFLF